VRDIPDIERRLTKTPISSISCTATTANGKKYELQFESDGSPITLRKIRQSSLTASGTNCIARRLSMMRLQGRHSAIR